ncbi:MAG: alpha/beta hydrolase fold domain-containing protein, partial [Propionibacteriaceae bacterium]|nr:alpha/beta hydrolase fold domain-containing protein [Propionibacteriaceae bacterium]
DLDYYMDSYLTSPAEMTSPYVDCLSADLTTLPPAFIAAAEYDPLRDDSAALAAMLDAQGRTNRHVVYPGVLHAFLHNSRLLTEAWTALRDGAAFCRDVFAPTTHR